MDTEQIKFFKSMAFEKVIDKLNYNNFFFYFYNIYVNK